MNSDITVDIKDTQIGGKLVTLSMISRYPEEYGPDDKDFEKYVKDTLAEGLAQYIINNRLCVFTKLKSPCTYEYTYNIRCYIAPNEEVKTLRKYVSPY